MAEFVDLNTYDECDTCRCRLLDGSLRSVCSECKSDNLCTSCAPRKLDICNGCVERLKKELGSNYDLNPTQVEFRYEYIQEAQFLEIDV